MPACLVEVSQGVLEGEEELGEGCEGGGGRGAEGSGCDQVSEELLQGMKGLIGDLPGG